MNEQELRRKAAAYGQQQVFAFWERLAPSEREKLLAQIASLDFNLVASLVKDLGRPAPELLEASRLQPSPVITLPKTEKELRAREAAREAGEAGLRAGRVGCFLVAGGQGTRLGLTGPKGCFDIGPIRKRSLFQLHAEKIQALRRRYDAAIPWVIMTSDATDADTRRFFDEIFYFGLGEESVRFCKQESLPAVGRDGRILLESRGSLALSPNGHGGAIKAIHDSGALAWLRTLGVDTLFYFQVDNVLVKLCDPVFLGHHLSAKAEFSSKVARKRDWREKVGVVGYLDGKLSVIEYSDLPDEVARQVLPDGSLRWWAGSIAIHVLDAGFLERLNAGGFQLPFHKAEKAVPCVMPATGGTLRLKPGEKNGVKFETFIFDALPLAGSSVTLETAREEDFAPIKNAAGEDSPESARQALYQLFAKWLEAAGHPVPRRPDGSPDCRIEISPLTSLEGEGLRERRAPPLKAGGELLL